MKEKTVKRNEQTANPQLAEEAHYLHSWLFHSQISPSLADRYARAHDFVKPLGTADQLYAIKTMVSRNLDPEALEMALRKKGAQHPLLQKIKILTYLAECDSRYYGMFVNEDPSLLKASSIMAYNVFRSAYKLMKGRYLRQKHGIV